MRSSIFALTTVAALSAASVVTVATDVDACGMAYPAGSFVRLTGEETVIVWDAAHKTEHFIRTPTFEGDPASFGFFMPTPETPRVEKVDPEVVRRVKALAIPPSPPSGGRGGAEGASAAVAGAAPVEVTQRITIDDFEIVSLAAKDADALGAWLAKNGFADKPALREWFKSYVAKNFIINALRYAGVKEKVAQAGRDPIAAPTLRFSFVTDRPFYPYTEPATDPAEARAYAERTGACTPGQDCKPSSGRIMDLFFVSHGPVRATIDDAPAGPSVTRVAEVDSRRLAGALGDTSKWGFDAAARKRWTLSHFVDVTEVRTATSDVVFAAIGPELPSAEARSGAGRPEAPLTARGRAKKALFGALALLVLFAIGVAFDEARTRAT